MKIKQDVFWNITLLMLMNAITHTVMGSLNMEATVSFVMSMKDYS